MYPLTWQERVLGATIRRLGNKTIARWSTPSHNYLRVSTRRWWPFIEVHKATVHKVYGLTSVSLTTGDAGSRVGTVNKRWQEVIEIDGEKYYSECKYQPMQQVKY